MNVFGSPVAGVVYGVPQQLRISVELSSGVRTGLVDGSLTLAVELSATSEFTTHAAIRLDGLAPQVSASPNNQTIEASSFPATLAAGTTVLTVDSVIVNNPTVAVWVFDTATSAWVEQLIAVGTPIPPMALTPQPGGLTITPGLVQNPIDIAHTGLQTYRVTVNMSSLHSNAAHPEVTLEFELHGGDGLQFNNPNFGQHPNGLSQWQRRVTGNYVQFRERARATTTADWPDWPDWPTSGNAGSEAGIQAAFPNAPTIFATPQIRVHETSQIFFSPTALVTGHIFEDPAALFSTGLAGTPGIEGFLSSMPPTPGEHPNQRLMASLSLSDTGAAILGQNHINRLSGTLVLEISYVIPNYNGATLTTRRVGGAAGPDTPGTVLFSRQTLVHGAAAVGVTFNGAYARQFVSGLWLPPITITETRPQSLHFNWTSGAPAGTSNINAAGVGGQTTHHLRLLGPRDYVWNVAPTAAQGVQPLSQLSVRDVRGVFATAIPTPTVLRHYIDPTTGRPALILSLTVPGRGEHPRQNVSAVLELNNLALIPTRDDVPTGDVYVELAFGRWTGPADAVARTIWTPQIGHLLVQQFNAAGFNATQRGAAEQALINIGRGLNATPLVQAATGNGRTSSPSVTDAANAILAGLTAAGVPSGSLPNLATVEGWIQSEEWGRTLDWFPTPGTPTGPTEDTWVNRLGNWGPYNKHVGIRGLASLELRTAGDVPTLLSGQANFPGINWSHTGDHPWSDNATNNALAGTRTARVQLHELVPGALDVGWMSSVANFALDESISEGVQFMHAAWRILNTAPGGDEVGWTHVPMRHLSDTLDAATAVGVPTLTTDDFRIFVPRNQTPNIYRTLEVVFWVSVRAGFEADFDGADILVNVSGSATANLDSGNTSEVIAYVVDPITVALLGELLPIDVGQVMTPTEVTPIPNIRISETDWGRLPRGEVFQIGIEAIPIGVLGNHAFLSNSGVIACVDGSGLEVRATQLTLTNGSMVMRFEVIRESIEANGPGTIILEDNRIMGTFLPGIQYGISVNAPAVAANTRRGWTGRGQFDAVPYFVEIIEFGEFDYEGLPPGIGEPGDNIPTPPQVLRLQEGVPFLGVDQPLVWETVGNYRVGMVSLRAFAYLIGIESDEIDWDEATQTAVIRGLSSQGVNAGVQVTQGVSTARVFEAGAWVNHDIASFAHGEGHVLSGSVSAVNRFDRLYVPFRFAANAFGYSVELIGYNLVEFR